MWTKVVLAALFAATTSARMCGDLNIKTFSDTECATPLDTTNGAIESCSTKYFKTKVDRGTVAAYCSEESMTFAFY